MCEHETQKLICAGYISGVTDTLALVSDISSKKSKPIVCLPEQGVSVDQSIKVVMKYIKLNPELSHKPARMTILLAYHYAFGCKSEIPLENQILKSKKLNTDRKLELLQKIFDKEN